MKRILDIILSSVALAISSPVLICTAIILKCTGEGEIFYIQTRTGRKGRPFGLYKFATMLKNSPNMGAGEITVRNDSRVLPFGKVLRKSKLNELPQLWNIIVGDMSIVGPRPMVPNTYSNYPEDARKKLDTVRPGLTGIGSIVFRDEESYLLNQNEPMEFYKEHIIPYKSSLEVWFIENNSLLLYLKIILVTAWVIFVPSNTLAQKLFATLPKMPDGLRKNSNTT